MPVPYNGTVAIIRKISVRVGVGETGRAHRCRLGVRKFFGCACKKRETVARRRASDVSDGWREGARFVLGSVKFRTRQAAT